jgi:tetratricopeptide (TPR) repeat protein
MLLVIAFLPGCGGAASPAAEFRREVAGDELRQAQADKPEALHGGVKTLLEEGDRNAVLNQMRLGADAFQLNHHDWATTFFDKALASIETVWAESERAAQARSVWYEEGMKDFKGEPYERAMAYYYRGLLYLWGGEIDNARASFKSGVLQDAFAEELQNRADFALLIYLEAWASRFMNDPSTEQAAFEELAKLRPDLPKIPPGANTLVVLETGLSPRKVGDGVGSWQLKFRRGKKFADAAAGVSVDGAPEARAYPVEDIFLQATTRGARPIDKIIEGKVEFRNTYQGLGSTLSDAGHAAMLAAPAFEHAGRVQAVGGGLSVLGAISTAVSINARPQADIRYWDNLPDAVHVLALSLKPGPHALQVRYYTKQGQELPDLAQHLEFAVPADGRPALVWTRSRQQLTSHTPSEETW